MGYDEFIQNIIDTRGRFGITEGYKERYHIVPKCLGGSNDDDNLIDLYAKEHYIVHKLLALENPNNQHLVCAWSMMAFPKGTTQRDYKLSPEEYEEARIAFSKIAPEINQGRKHTPEARKNMSDSKKGKKFSEEHKQHLSESNIGKHDHHGENNPMYGKQLFGEANGMYGRKHSEETKAKQSEKIKNYYKTHSIHWYNNGIIEVRAETCPDGFVSGKLYRPRKNKVEVA